MRSKIPALLLLLLAAGCHSSSDSASEAPFLVVNLGLTGQQVFGTGDLRLVAVSEAAEGRDLDGDGDEADVVMHVLDLATGALTSTELALPPRFRRDEVPPPEFLCNDSLGVFQASEEETGRDLDEDGIPGEVTTWVYDRRTGELRDLGFAHFGLMLDGDLAVLQGFDAALDIRLHVLDAVDGSLTTLPFELASPVAIGNGIVAFAVPELGAMDLNGDGDTSDGLVLHLFDSDSGQVRNTLLVMAAGQVRIVAGFAGFSAYESDNGDLNGDGDAFDPLFVAVEARTGLTRIPGFFAELAPFALPSLAARFDDPELFLLSLLEFDLDRNSDGDTADHIAVVYDPISDRLVEFPLALSRGSSLVRTGRWLGSLVSEEAQNMDLDGDGRLESHLMHVADIQSGRNVNLGLAGQWTATVGDQLLGQSFIEEALVPLELVAWDPRANRLRHTGTVSPGVLGTAKDRALVIQLERGFDLNDDGDGFDQVFALYDARTATVRSLGIATTNFTGGLGPGGQAVVLVSEEAQGEDLNGDGDRVDFVLHQIYIDAPQG